VSGDFFATVKPGLTTGRALAAGDDQPAAPRVAVISHHLWMRELGGRTDVVGVRLYVRDEPFVIVGVTAPGFRGLTNGGFFAPADVLFPLAAQPTVSPRAGPEGPGLFRATDRLWLRGIARVPAAERAALEPVVTGTLRNALAATGRLDAAQIARVSAVLTPAARGENGIRQQTERPLEILAIIVAAVLAIACINVAGLLLARGLARQRELSVRRALGAARVQLMRLVVVEVLVLAVAGAVLGVAFAAWSGPLVMHLLTAGAGDVTVDASLDWTVLAWTGGLVVAVMLLCAVLPAWRLTRAPRALDLRHRTIGASGTRLMLGRGLLALQIAITVPLLVGALLFVRTLYNLSGVEPGFDTRGLAMFSIPSSTPGRPVDVAPAVLGQLLARLEALPGVESATLVENALLSGWTSNASVTIAGQPARMAMNAVGPRFFETMGMPLVAGRGPDRRDDPAAPPVAVINQTAARTFFPGQSPIGQPIAQATRQLTIIGVVEDAKYESLRSDIRPTFFDSILQRPAGSAVRVVLRTSRVPASLEAGIRAAVTATSPSLAVADLKTQQDQIDEKTGTERLFARLLSAFAVFALLLACIGVHGATAWAVTRRTSEIGIRLALGAQRGSVLWLLLRQVFALALAGLAIGLPVAWWAGPLVRSLIFGLDATDVVTLAAAAAATFMVALVAGFLPARRASHIDPIDALRQD
jgi:predicted permease